MQFISFVMICQIWKEKKEGKLEISGNLAKDFHGRIILLSLGNYTWLIRTIGNLNNGFYQRWVKILTTVFFSS
jgi:hypothetical protein